LNGKNDSTTKNRWLHDQE
jgi:hypothetical protein